MDKKEYKYDAFISYRHCDLDKFVAENLHKTLETYELPKNIKEKLGITGRTIKRVFRDQDELPLSSNLEDPILDALNNSKYLIVICSPRLKESLWCKKEIETFKKIRGRKNIFCVLIEGEPSDSFPEEVLYDEETVTDKSGKKKKVKKLVEPLAADVRGVNKKEVLKKIKEEKLRLISPMYNLDYDDLKQRHKLRKMKKMIFISTIVSICAILFALYSTFMFLKIFNQQRTLKKHQAISLSSDAKDYLEKDSKYNAVKSSYSALTKFNGVKMPYTSEAEYNLSESLGVYDVGLSYKSTYELKTKGVVDYVKVSDDLNYALSFDESEELVLWDLINFKKLNSFDNLNAFTFDDEHFIFLASDKFAYISKDGNVIVRDIKTGKELKNIKKIKYSYQSIATDMDGKYLVINDSPNLYLYDTTSFKMISEHKFEKENIADEMYFSSDGSKLFVGTSIANYDILKATKTTMHNLNTNDLKENNSFVLNSSYLSGTIENGDNIIFISHQSVGTDYASVITSYNYKNGEVNYEKVFDGAWFEKMVKSNAKGVNSFAVSHGNVVDVYNLSNGSFIQSFSLSSDVIGIYSSYDKDIYLAFTTNGTVSFLSLEYKEVINYTGLYQLNLNKYTIVLATENGYLLVPKNDNRIIYYEKTRNKDLKKEDIKLDYVEDDSVNVNDLDKVKKDYNIKNKNLVKSISYDSKKTLMFVSYTNNKLVIYSVKDKNILGEVSGVSQIYHYFGKDKKGRIYVGNLNESYILNKDYEKVGHIKSLVKLDEKKDRVIISNNDGTYSSLPVYYLDDLLKLAKEYLKR